MPGDLHPKLEPLGFYFWNLQSKVCNPQVCSVQLTAVGGVSTLKTKE